MLLKKNPQASAGRCTGDKNDIVVQSEEIECNFLQGKEGVFPFCLVCNVEWS